MPAIYNGLVEEMIGKMTTEEKENFLRKLQLDLGKEPEKELLEQHCPLCGGDLEIVEHVDERTWNVTCTKCGCGGLCGIRKDDEDLPTDATLALGEEMRRKAHELLDAILNGCPGLEVEMSVEDEGDEDYEDDYEEEEHCCCPHKKCCPGVDADKVRRSEDELRRQAYEDLMKARDREAKDKAEAEAEKKVKDAVQTILESVLSRL